MKKSKIMFIFISCIIFLVIFLLSVFEYLNYAKLTNSFVVNIVEKINNDYPNIEISEIVDIINSPNLENNNSILYSYGFSENDINIISSLQSSFYNNLKLNFLVFLIFLLIIVIYIRICKYKNAKELKSIINYLKKLNSGNYDLQIDLNSEGLLSILKNEIYKTTIMLREKAEKELKDKINLKDSLTNISHQLKTPLTSISLLVDNLDDEQIDYKLQKEFLNDIKIQIKNINYLIIILLKLSRFDANVIVFKKEIINVKKLIFEILKYIDVIREVKNINVHVNGANDITFIGDYKWEFEAISNILKNSLEYTSENKNIYISFSKNNLYTEIVIKDEGKGMTNEEKKKIFERFYKGPNSTTNNFGIGMSLAKEIINKDNGKIKIESEINKGTIFKIRYYK